MKWKMPPRIKIYEALGCIGDNRIEMSENSARIYSSSKNKAYAVNYDGTDSIMSNDNGSYWQGYLGYPSIAFLMKKGIIEYDPRIADALKGIHWKDINDHFKGDYAKKEEFVLKIAEDQGILPEIVEIEIERIELQIRKQGLSIFGKKMRPPSG
jgi:hypothetical protein